MTSQNQRSLALLILAQITAFFRRTWIKSRGTQVPTRKGESFPVPPYIIHITCPEGEKLPGIPVRVLVDGILVRIRFPGSAVGKAEILYLPKATRSLAMKWFRAYYAASVKTSAPWRRTWVLVGRRGEVIEIRLIPANRNPILAANGSL